jgi:hypothetical protein
MNKAFPDVSARLLATTSLGANPSVDISDKANGSYSATGTVTLAKSDPIAKGHWVVINAPKATVRITNDITYTNAALSSLTDIPQVVIIADRINIDAGVTRVDAWLIATGTSGTISTCTEVGDPNQAGQLNANKCNLPLIVNGPVMARHLLLFRTAGAGTGVAAGDPSEVFNLRPDAYLWATGLIAGAGRLQTVSTKELPPRF